MLTCKLKQSGNFSVEFAIVGVFFALMLAFSGDIIIKLATKGKLERLSFSLVNVLKERTELYGGNFSPSDAQARTEAIQLQTIAENSLRRTFGTFVPAQFGILVEAQTSANTFQQFQGGGQQCQAAQPFNTLLNLSVQTSWFRQASLYRVTICYATANWFGAISGGTINNLIQSSSVMIGR